jgi:hypothetical protein
MHPAFALARTRLTETRSEIDAFLQANDERLTPLEASRPSRRQTGLRAYYASRCGRSDSSELKNLEWNQRR